jgi:predicted metal-binding membrane protein
MKIIFFAAGVYLTFVGFLIWFFPEILIKINDWLTEKTLLHKKIGIFYRIITGGITLTIAGIFWWTLFSK